MILFFSDCFIPTLHKLCNNSCKVIGCYFELKKGEYFNFGLDCLLLVKFISIGYWSSKENFFFQSFGWNDHDAKSILQEAFLDEWVVFIVLIHERNGIGKCLILEMALCALPMHPSMQVDPIPLIIIFLHPMQLLLLLVYFWRDGCLSNIGIAVFLWTLRRCVFMWFIYYLLVCECGLNRLSLSWLERGWLRAKDCKRTIVIRGAIC